MIRKHRNVNDVKLVGGKPVEPTSSLNDYMMCVCGKKYLAKISLIKHLKICTGVLIRHRCVWCNVEFSTQGNLSTHTKHLHGVNIKKDTEYKCAGCNVTYKDRWRMKYHIRKQHFNLSAIVPHAEAKRVNQVWFEKVQNTDMVVQIQKAGVNKLVIKPTQPEEGIKIHDRYKVIDLHRLYPTTHRSSSEETCKFCKKVLKKINMQKHINDIHYDIARHKCDYCNISFKRFQTFVNHECKEGQTKVIGVKHHVNNVIKITSADSLKPVVVD